MKAVILAGGKGTRLMPYTAFVPKPLMPVGDMPILELLLRQLKSYGVDEVILAVNHLHHLIRAFFGDGSDIGLKLSYELEDRPLGTSGPIAACLDRLPEEFLVSNGDLLTTLNFGAMMRAHRESGAAATVATHQRTIQVEFGALTISDQGAIQEYREKPTLNFNAGIGMYVLSKSAVKPLLPIGEYSDMPDLIRGLISRGEIVRSYSEDCTWIDIGQPKDYALAQERFMTERSFFLPNE